MNTESNKNYTAKTHYKGNVAKSYLNNRTRSLKWRTEQNLMSKMISNLPKGSWILDIPVGTGRLLPFYAKGNYPVYGMDISKEFVLTMRIICHIVEKVKNLYIIYKIVY